MEVFAAFAAHTDYEIGRVVKAIEDMGELDNTMIIYEVGDNGASAEGGMNGMFNEMTYFNGVVETVPDMLKNIDKWGDPSTFPHMAAGWAVAGNTPFQWTKQVASNFGGTRNPLVISWPKRIKAKGEVRSQFQHVVDLAPTVLEAANIPEPKTVNGVAQTPMEGVSMVYTFDDAEGRRPAQDPVLRDLRQPRHLQRRLGGGDRAQGAVGSGAPPQALRRHLGALQRERGLQRIHRPGGIESGQAEGDAGAVHDGSGEVPRACRSTTGRSSASIPPSPAGPT